MLVLCTENSCRSQMTEGILRHLMGDKFEAESAGTRPSVVNPVAVKVMAEIGIDISGHRSKSVQEFQGMKGNRFTKRAVTYSGQLIFASLLKEIKAGCGQQYLLLRYFWNNPCNIII